MYPTYTLATTIWTLVGFTLARCPTPTGSFFVEHPNIYPETAAFDPGTCQLFISAEYNCTFVVHDFASQTTRSIEIPGITGACTADAAPYHINGIDYDPSSGHIFVAVSDSEAFLSVIAEGPDGGVVTDYANANYTGSNYIAVYDPKTERVVSVIDLGPAQEVFHRQAGNYTSGVQDMAEVRGGDAYAISTFGNSLFKIAKGSHTAELWYAPAIYKVSYGFGGIVAIGEKLIISDSISGGLVTFDTATADHPPHPTYIPLRDLPPSYRPQNADGLFAPTKYSGKILLWSDDQNGTSVYGSGDDWATAHYLGLVPLEDHSAIPTATFDIGERIFAVAQFFQFELPVVPKKSWPFYDVTEEVEGIVKNSFLGDLCE